MRVYEKKKMTKRMLLLFLFVFSCTCASAHSHRFILYDHSEIEALSTFRIRGEIDLRTEKDVSAPVIYRTLNHEGGMKVTVLEILDEAGFQNTEGMWLYVLLMAPMWVDDGTWIEKYNKFLIFLPDEIPVFDFEKH